MKIRSGFVSNSSSSSFCIIGVTGFWVDQLAEAEHKQFREPEPIKKEVSGCEHTIKKGKFCPTCGAPATKVIETMPEDAHQDYLSYGSESGDVVTFYGDDYPNYAGVDAEKILETMSIKEARVYFRELMIKKLNVNIPESAIGFHYGESGNG